MTPATCPRLHRLRVRALYALLHSDIPVDVKEPDELCVAASVIAILSKRVGASPSLGPQNESCLDKVGEYKLSVGFRRTNYGVENKLWT